MLYSLIEASLLATATVDAISQQYSIPENMYSTAAIKH